MDRRAIVEEFFHALWQDGDVAVVDRYFADETEVEGLTHDMALRAEDFTTFAQSILMLVSDVEFRILKVIEDGDWITVLVRCTAISRATGRQVESSGQTTMRFRGDRIVEAYNHYDLFGVFAQLGLIPQDALDVILGGAAAA